MKRKNCIFDLVYVDGNDSNGNPILKKVEEFGVDTIEEATEYVKNYNEFHTDHTYYFTDNFSIKNCGVLFKNRVVFRGADSVDLFFYGKISNLHRRYMDLRKKQGSESQMCHLVKMIARIRRMWGNKSIRKMVSVLMSMWDSISWWMWEFPYMKFHDFRYSIRRLIYFNKYHHDNREPWSLDIHMLRDLRWNLKRLIEESQGIPNNFMKDAWFELNPNGTEEEWHKVCSFSPELEELSIKKRNECYLNLIHLIELYGFYAMTDVGEDGEEIDERDFELIKVEGSWDRPEYQGMHERATQVWNQIWDEVKKYGQGMWD